MSSAKMILLAVLFTGLSVVIGGSTGAYIGYRKAQEKLGVQSGTLGKTFSTFANFEETLQDIAAADEGPFGKRAVALRERYPFTPPANGALTDEQMRKFLAVKEALAAIDQEMAADIERDGGKEPSAGFILKWNFFTRLKRLRDVQIEALEQQSMTLEEYNWVHLQVYKVLMAEGVRPEENRAGITVDETFDQSARAIDQELASNEITPERRQELEALRKRLEEGREVMTGAADQLQKSLSEIPPGNRQLVEQYQERIAKTFFVAIDLDTVDVMRAMETAGAS